MMRLIALLILLTSASASATFFPTIDVTKFGSNPVVTGTGTSGAGIPRVTTSSDSSLTCNAGTNLNTSALATSANQTTANSSLSTIATNTTGASTAANQSTANATLSTISTNLTNGTQKAIALPSDGTKATYSASATAISAAVTATDIFAISGSASKTIRILRISLNLTETTSAARQILIIKRSTANTGASNAVTAVPHDSTSAAATASVVSYAANPTLGTAVGTIRSQWVEANTAGAGVDVDRLIIDFGNRPGQALVLRGTTEQLTINLNGVTLAGNSFDINIEWTEE